MSILDAIADLLADHGFTVARAGNGRDGLERLAEIGRPCLILLDLMMPVMDGTEMLARLLDDPLGRTIPVVVITATQQPPPEGTRGLLRKPFGLKALLALAEAHCPKGS